MRRTGMVACLLLAGSAGYQAWAARRDVRRFPPPGELADLDGRVVHLLRAGTGGPAVVIVTALGAPAAEWALVQSRLASETSVLLYDRAGLGWSTPRRRPPTIAAMTAELEQVLRAAVMPGPYILVGHSLGGMVTRLYAARHPGQVAGLVLVDTVHHEQFRRAGDVSDWRLRLRRLGALLIAGGRHATPLGILRLGAAVGLAPGRRRAARARFPSASPAEALALTLRPRLRRTLAGEAYALLTGGALLREQAPSLGNIPLTVITRAKPAHADGRVAAALELREQLQREIAGLSADSRLLVAERAGHQVHRDDPGLIVRAVTDIVRRLRDQRAAAGSS